jgi:L-ascorbate metabolism protein UlaG (beta-lactamase superfamily)
MKITKLDDYQSWMISEADVHVVLDPWLTDRFTLPLGAWFFHRGRSEAPTPASTLPKPSALLLSAHFDDHLSPETLRAFDATVPIHTTRQAASRLRSLGFENARAHVPGSTFDVGDRLRITTIPCGFPYAGNSLGFLVESRVTGTSAYFEAHATDEGKLGALPAGLDALICPCESVFSGLIQLSMDPERTARTIARLRPKRYMPTGIDPSRSEGVLGRLGLRMSGTVEDLTGILTARRLSTEVIAPRTGEWIALA